MTVKDTTTAIDSIDADTGIVTLTENAPTDATVIFTRVAVGAEGDYAARVTIGGTTFNVAHELEYTQEAYGPDSTSFRSQSIFVEANNVAKVTWESHGLAVNDYITVVHDTTISGTYVVDAIVDDHNVRISGFDYDEDVEENRVLANAVVTKALYSAECTLSFARNTVPNATVPAIHGGTFSFCCAESVEHVKYDAEYVSGVEYTGTSTGTIQWSYDGAVVQTGGSSYTLGIGERATSVSATDDNGTLAELSVMTATSDTVGGATSANPLVAASAVSVDSGTPFPTIRYTVQDLHAPYRIRQTEVYDSAASEVRIQLSVESSLTKTIEADLGYTFQWTRDDEEISGATSGTYTLSSADEGTMVRCTVAREEHTMTTDELYVPKYRYMKDSLFVSAPITIEAPAHTVTFPNPVSGKKAIVEKAKYDLLQISIDEIPNDLKMQLKVNGQTDDEVIILRNFDFEWDHEDVVLSTAASFWPTLANGESKLITVTCYTMDEELSRIRFDRDVYFIVDSSGKRYAVTTDRPCVKNSTTKLVNLVDDSIIVNKFAVPSDDTEKKIDLTFTIDGEEYTMTFEIDAEEPDFTIDLDYQDNEMLASASGLEAGEKKLIIESDGSDDPTIDTLTVITTFMRHEMTYEWDQNTGELTFEYDPLDDRDDSFEIEATIGDVTRNFTVSLTNVLKSEEVVYYSGENETVMNFTMHSSFTKIIPTIWPPNEVVDEDGDTDEWGRVEVISNITQLAEKLSGAQETVVRTANITGIVAQDSPSVQGNTFLITVDDISTLAIPSSIDELKVRIENLGDFEVNPIQNRENLDVYAYDDSANTLTIQRMSGDYWNGSNINAQNPPRLEWDELTSTSDVPKTKFEVVNHDMFPDSGVLKIGQEHVSYSGKAIEKDRPVFTGITRGVNGTTRESHKENTNIALVTSEDRDVVVKFTWPTRENGEWVVTNPKSMVLQHPLFQTRAQAETARDTLLAQLYDERSIMATDDSAVQITLDSKIDTLAKGDMIKVQDSRNSTWTSVQVAEINNDVEVTLNATSLGLFTVGGRVRFQKMEESEVRYPLREYEDAVTFFDQSNGIRTGASTITKGNASIDNGQTGSLSMRGFKLDYTMDTENGGILFSNYDTVALAMPADASGIIAKAGTKLIDVSPTSSTSEGTAVIEFIVSGSPQLAVHAEFSKDDDSVDIYNAEMHVLTFDVLDDSDEVLHTQDETIYVSTEALQTKLTPGDVLIASVSGLPNYTWIRGSVEATP